MEMYLLRSLQVTRALGEAAGGAGTTSPLPQQHCPKRTLRPWDPGGPSWAGPSFDAQRMRTEIDWPHRPWLLGLLPCYASRWECHAPPHPQEGAHLVLWVPSSQQQGLELNTVCEEGVWASVCTLVEVG